MNIIKRVLQQLLHRSSLRYLKWDTEQHMKDTFDSVLSKRIDCIVYLMESEPTSQNYEKDKDHDAD